MWSGRCPTGKNLLSSINAQIVQISHMKDSFISFFLSMNNPKQFIFWIRALHPYLCQASQSWTYQWKHFRWWSKSYGNMRSCNWLWCICPVSTWAKKHLHPNKAIMHSNYITLWDTHIKKQHHFCSPHSNQAVLEIQFIAGFSFRNYEEKTLGGNLKTQGNK